VTTHVRIWPSTRRVLVFLLLLVGAACLAWVGGVQAISWYVQTSNDHLLDDQIRARASGAVAPAGSDTTGRLEISRIGLRAIVLEGTDDNTLRVAVGHIAGTPWPGRGGHAALAGHRDTFFRPLRQVRIGDEIKFTSAAGVFRYRVAETEVVGPSDVEVLDPKRGTMLTLVTCYPFSFVGRAPRRFIVHARPIE
jgi:sortase A